MTEHWEYGAAAGEAGAGEAGDAGSAAGRGFPWPPSEHDSILASFAETWKRSTFEPGTFFDRVPRTRGTGAAVLYYLVLVLVVAGASLFWDSLALFGAPLDDATFGMGMESISPIVSFLLTPGILLVMLFLSAAITHGILSLFDGARHGFGTTVRVFCYAYSPGLFGVVPLLGGLVGSIWMVVLLIIGLREAHETDGWKSAVAVLLPFFLLLGLVTVALLMVAAAGAALLGTGLG